MEAPQSKREMLIDRAVSYLERSFLLYSDWDRVRDGMDKVKKFYGIDNEYILREIAERFFGLDVVRKYAFYFKSVYSFTLKPSEIAALSIWEKRMLGYPFNKRDLAIINMPLWKKISRIRRQKDLEKYFLEEDYSNFKGLKLEDGCLVLKMSEDTYLTKVLNLSEEDIYYYHEASPGYHESREVYIEDEKAYICYLFNEETEDKFRELFDMINIPIEFNESFYDTFESYFPSKIDMLDQFIIDMDSRKEDQGREEAWESITAVTEKIPFDDDGIYMSVKDWVKFLKPLKPIRTFNELEDLNLSYEIGYISEIMMGNVPEDGLILQNNYLQKDIQNLIDEVDFADEETEEDNNEEDKPNLFKIKQSADLLKGVLKRFGFDNFNYSGPDRTIKIKEVDYDDNRIKIGFHWKNRPGKKDFSGWIRIENLVHFIQQADFIGENFTTTKKKLLEGR